MWTFRRLPGRTRASVMTVALLIGATLAVRGAADTDADLQRLVDGGLIAEGEAEPDPANGQLAQRRYYALTPRGWDALKDEAAHFGSAQAFIDRVLADARSR